MLSSVGWTKTHRSIYKKWHGKDWKLANMLIFLVSNACYEDTEISRGTRKIGLKRGQCFFTSRQIGSLTGLSKNGAQKILDQLRKTGTIEAKTDRNGYLITICNYNEYQGVENIKESKKDRKRIASDVEDGSQTVSHRGHIYKEERNNKKETTINNTLHSLPSTVVEGVLVVEKPVKVVSDVFLDIGTKWLNFALQEMPWKAKDKKWDATSFGAELERVARIMNLNVEGIHKILDFISKDEFWRKNAVSPFGLLKKSGTNDLRKIDNVIKRMHSRQHRVEEAIQRFVKSPDKIDGRPF